MEAVADKGELRLTLRFGASSPTYLLLKRTSVTNGVSQDGAVKGLRSKDIYKDVLYSSSQLSYVCAQS